MPSGGIARITPAHAGKSALEPLQRVLLWDHPRACGEKTARADCTRTAKDHPRACGEKTIVGWG